MNHLTVWSIGILLVLGNLALADTTAAPAPKPKYGPAAGPYATTLVQSHDYFRTHAAPDFWALIGYYVPQYNEAACSAASVTMALNAARATLPKTSDDKLIRQPDLVEKTQVDNWKDRLSEAGFGPQKLHGASLDILRDIAEAAFRANGFPNAKTTAIHADDDKARARIHALLVKNEKSADDFILANFNQQAFTDDADAGHIAPVGAYDAQKKRVLILDPDREWYEPYWISEDRFFAAMHTQDSEVKIFRGLVYIELGAR